MLTTEQLKIGYKTRKGRNVVVAGRLNLSLPPGVTAMLGRNGAGKSTLIKTLTGYLPALSGRVLVNDRPLNELSRNELANQIAVVTTDPHMAGGLRLEELVGLGRIPYVGTFGKLGKEDKEKVKSGLEAVGLYHKKDSFIAELSDGERQKGMIAKGLVQDTPIIIMDEPFSFLDAASRLEMTALILRLAEKRKKAILFSTHEVAEALRMIGRIWMFTTEGEIVEGSTDRLIEDGIADRLFPNPGIAFDKITKDFRII